MTLEDTMEKLCKAGARAVQRYAEVSGMSPDEEMPECFLSAYFFDHFGDEVTMTIETSARKLLGWNDDQRQRQGLLPAGPADLGLDARRLVDLILFKDAHLPKNKQNFFALVEFKSGWIDGARNGDRDKLLRLLKHIDTCPMAWSAVGRERQTVNGRERMLRSRGIGGLRVSSRLTASHTSSALPSLDEPTKSGSPRRPQFEGRGPADWAHWRDGQMARSQVVGNIGMYYAAYCLSQWGWNVMPTSRNARGIDLLVYDATADRKRSIQVKALSKRNPVPLGKSIKNLMGDWWIIVAKATTTKPECFVMKPDEVRRLAHRGEKDGMVSFWLQPNQYDTDEFRERWDRIGRGDDQVVIPMRAQRP